MSMNKNDLEKFENSEIKYSSIMTTLYMNDIVYTGNIASIDRHIAAWVFMGT